MTRQILRYVARYAKSGQKSFKMAYKCSIWTWMIMRVHLVLNQEYPVMTKFVDMCKIWCRGANFDNDCQTKNDKKCCRTSITNNTAISSVLTSAAKECSIWYYMTHCVKYWGQWTAKGIKCPVCLVKAYYDQLLTNVHYYWQFRQALESYASFWRTSHDMLRVDKDLLKWSINT